MAEERKEPGFSDLLKWQWNRMWKKIPGPGAYHFPLAENDPDFLKSPHGTTTLTWIGHATLLLQVEGKSVLTDPVYSERASPVRWAGPQRVVRPGLAFEDLPKIDYVFISHNHYDALDKGTVLNLRKRDRGEETIFFVPLGLKGWFGKLGITRVVELGWWEKERQDGFEMTAVPVKHWSKRAFSKRNDTLWAGWILRSDRFRFFFAGDSGYTPLFQEIGNRFGPFDLAAIPIGAYEPRWFMKYHHLSPEEAVRVHRDVRAKKSVAIHWGTYILTDEPLDEPPERLRRELEKEGIPEHEFLVLRHGETVFPA